MAKVSSLVGVSPKPISYFLCSEPHKVAKCQNKKVLNTLKTLQSKTDSLVEEEEGQDQG